MRAAHVTEYTPALGQLNRDTIAWMVALARDAGKREDVRRLVEEWLYARKVPPRDDYAEAIAVYHLVHQRVPYRKDPAEKERVKAPWVALGLAGGKPFRGGDCDDIATAIAGALLALGHQPVRYRTVGVGGIPSHVHAEVWVNRPRKQRGWLALDPVAHPQPPGFRPPGDVEHHYTVYAGFQPPAMAGAPHMSKHSGISYPESDVLFNFVTGQTNRTLSGAPPPGALFGAAPGDIHELAAELARTDRRLANAPIGTVLVGDTPESVGVGLSYLGDGPIGAYYADRAGGVWEELPADAVLGLVPLGFFSWAKKALKTAHSIAKKGARIYRKVAKPAAMIAAFVPGVGPAVSAGIIAVDQAAKYGLKASEMAERVGGPWVARAEQAITHARRLKERYSKFIPDQSARAFARAFPAVTALGPAYSAMARHPGGQQLAQTLMRDHRRYRREVARRNPRYYGACCLAGI